jgi:uncharacterized membrane protein
MGWIGYVFLVFLGLTTYSVAGKISGGKVEPFLSTTIALFVSLALMAIATAFYYWKNSLSLSIDMGSTGIKLSALMGICVMMINVGYIFAYSKGGPIGVVSPIATSASIGAIVLISAAFFGEGLSAYKVVGTLLIGAGIFFIMKSQ